MRSVALIPSLGQYHLLVCLAIKKRKDDESKFYLFISLLPIISPWHLNPERFSRRPSFLLLHSKAATLFPAKSQRWNPDNTEKCLRLVIRTKTQCSPNINYIHELLRESMTRSKLNQWIRLWIVKSPQRRFFSQESEERFVGNFTGILQLYSWMVRNNCCGYSDDTGR